MADEQWGKEPMEYQLLYYETMRQLAPKTYAAVKRYGVRNLSDFIQIREEKLRGMLTISDRIADKIIDARNELVFKILGRRCARDEVEHLATEIVTDSLLNSKNKSLQNLPVGSPRLEKVQQTNNLSHGAAHDLSNAVSSRAVYSKMTSHSSEEPISTETSNIFEQAQDNQLDHGALDPVKDITDGNICTSVPKQAPTTVDDNLSMLEFRYRMLIRKCDLIGQLQISVSELQEITEKLAQELGERKNDKERFVWFCRQFPAVISVFLTFTAAYDYVRETGNYWSGVRSRLSLEDVPYDRQRTLGETFNNFLATANLVQFPHTKRPYIYPILLHATIPVDCLDNFFDTVVIPLALDEDFGDMLKPIELFLTEGGNVADNFVNRCLELYKELTRRVEGDQSLEELAERFGLATLVVERLVEWFDQPERQRRTERLLPRIVLDPADLGVALEVPERLVQRYGYSLRICCNSEEYKHNLYSKAYDLGGQRVYRVPLYEPSIQYEIQLGNQVLGTLRGITPDEPRYFSTTTGRRVLGELPAGLIYVLSPADLSPRGNGPGQQDLVIEEFPLLLGRWGAANIHTLNTQGYQSVEWLDKNGQKIEQYGKPIRNHDLIQPQVRGGSPWNPVLAESATAPIYLGAPPNLFLFVDETKRDRYRFRAEDGSGTKLLFEYSFEELEAMDAIEKEANGAVIRLGAAGLLQQVYGHIKLSVQGPLGADSSLNLILLPAGLLEIGPLTQDDSGLWGSYLKVSPQARVAVKLQVEQERLQPIAGIYVPPTEVAKVTLVGESEIGSFQFPIRLRPAEWRTVTAGDNEPKPWEWQSTVRALGDHWNVSSEHLLVRSYFAEGARHKLMLLADGEEVLTLPGTTGEQVPQYSSFALDQLADAFRQYAAKELILELVVQTSTIELRLPVAEILFDWRIADLEVEVNEGDLCYIAASWRESGAPAARRYWYLHDLWRNRSKKLVPLEENATSLEELFTPEELPPGQYVLRFCTRRLSGKERAPISIYPVRTIDVGKGQWQSLFDNVVSPAQWLMAVRAHCSGYRCGLADSPPFDAWAEPELVELAELLIELRRNPKIIQVSKAICWSLPERLQLYSIATQHLRKDPRDLAMALLLPSQVAGHDFDLLASTPRGWRGLQRVCDPGLVNGVDPYRLQYAWGTKYGLREPEITVAGLHEEFHADRPSTLLAKWLQASGKSVFDGIEHAHKVRRMYEIYLPKLHRVARRAGFNALKGFQACLSGIEPLFEEQVRASGTGTIAYVTACTASIQRWVAREPRLAGFLEKEPSTIQVCDWCPELYDYYLCLAEAIYQLS